MAFCFIFRRCFYALLWDSHTWASPAVSHGLFRICICSNRNTFCTKYLATLCRVWDWSVLPISIIFTCKISCCFLLINLSCCFISGSTLSSLVVFRVLLSSREECGCMPHCPQVAPRVSSLGVTRMECLRLSPYKKDDVISSYWRLEIQQPGLEHGLERGPWAETSQNSFLILLIENKTTATIFEPELTQALIKYWPG